MTTDISFYFLNNLNLNLLICSLITQYYHSKNHIYILCDSKLACYDLDEYIINFQQEKLKSNFFPYQLVLSDEPVGPIPPAPICLGHEANQDLSFKLKYDILINLAQIIPHDFLRYKKILEFIPGDLNKEARIVAREHYKHYIKFNCHIQTINNQYEPS
ncbi:MAG: DNA polymerase III subunit chi [Gammaproteobacteria bacterium]|nr:DNA polymerase III subunit chi [Gammaproteobacteria bacterium]